MVCEEWFQGGQRWRHQLGGCCSPPGENDQAGLSHGHGKEDLDDGSDWLGRPAHLPKWGWGRVSGRRAAYCGEEAWRSSRSALPGRQEP